ncbi:lytic murein transglycosylase [Methyloceanibacter sp.]|uniref:lytic murein transglycosylase n=1 Tax=Methyloceanibacter sp. TaxID=1965321 RepID=UPI002CE9BB51|nr:lytic murein transglycosylase [Methyloceanibacter sp.]HML93605.1 lytic murein transglycosylase [Methyloceanibacter sp.]
MTFPKILISAALSAGLAGLSAVTVSTPAHADRFQTCVKSFWPAAKKADVSWDTFQRATAGITLDQEVIESAKYQPEYKKPMGEYVERAISPKRLSMGQQKLVEYGPLLEQVEARYGVDKHIVLAIWGVESNYGTNKGDKQVIQSLMTLACSGTKAKFARGQIVSALKILQHGDTDPAHFNGSWAGAMGHTQFIPTTYSAYAVDFDGDGRRDIWDTIPDALGSTAAYLRKSKWVPGQTWGYEVRLPKSYTAKSYKRGTLRTLAQWEAAGITRVNGKPFPRPGDQAQLLSPDGRNGPSFLVLNNFRSILRYNQADSYALAVGHLADRLAGYEPFVQPWPTSEDRLSMEQRMELQRHLVALGHLEGDVDGIIGSGTLEGVRSYQRAKGLPVDGYPTQTILKKLRADAPAIVPAAVPAAPAVTAPQSTASIPAPQAVPPAAQQQAAQPQAPAPQALVPQGAMPQGAMPQAFAPQVYPQQPHPLQTLPWDSWHTGGMSSHPRSAADAAPPPGN